MFLDASTSPDDLGGGTLSPKYHRLRIPKFAREGHSQRTPREAGGLLGWAVSKTARVDSNLPA